jgi:sarcosine oxidase subunit gamma
VDDLTATSPLAGFPPLEIGGNSLSEASLGQLTLIAPFAGQTAATSQALAAAHDMAFPQPNRATGKVGARAIWFGREMALLAGPAPDASLEGVAALTDQSDAWAAVSLSGPGAEDVLARLVPVDLRVAEFKRGHTARSLLGHMNASITRTGAQTFLILVFRSMAETLRHDLKEAMEAVAARG